MPTRATSRTSRSFLAGQGSADKAAGTDPDRVGFGFGCAGEEVQVNRLVVRKVGPDEEFQKHSVIWDLVAPRGFAEITQETDIGSDCQLTRNKWPNVAERGVKAEPEFSWVMEWSPAEAGPWAQLRKPNGQDVAGAGNAGGIPIALPSRPGLLRLRVPATHDYGGRGTRRSGDQGASLSSIC